MKRKMIFLVVAFLTFFVQEGNARLGFDGEVSYKSSVGEHWNDYHSKKNSLLSKKAIFFEIKKKLKKLL